MQQKTWRSLSTQENDSFSGVYLYLLTGIILLIAVFLFVRPASAQTVEEAAGEPVVEVPVTEEAVVSESVSEPSQEVILDETVTPAQLGVADSSVLQDSPLYWFKRFGRQLRETFTFDSVKKSQLQLRHASQELADVTKLLQEKSIKEVDPAVLDKALSYVDQKGEAIKLRAVDIQKISSARSRWRGIC